MTTEQNYICMHCGGEVFWSLPQPDDPCYDCGKPIALDPDVAAPDRETGACPRCGETMEWRHSSEQCPRCRYKVGCCEGDSA